MKINKFYSFIFWILLKIFKFRKKNKYFKFIWFFIWDFSIKNYSGGILTKIHGFRAIINNGNSYPIFTRLFPQYNNPLIQLVFSTSKYLKRKVTMIDIGSAIGDTNLLLERNLPSVIERFYCIEGDKLFFKYLKENMKNLNKAILFNSLLSEADGKMIKNLEKTHLGTASSIGNKNSESISLDTLLINKIEMVDVIKIDVDGLDGKVLCGGKKLISKFKPNIIFEWHPIMIKKTKNNFNEHFAILNDLGYTKFLWYTKYGIFSHFSLESDYLNIEMINNMCLRGIHDWDFHYDIIAIHKESNINILELAELKNAKGKLSSF